MYTISLTDVIQKTKLHYKIFKMDSYGDKDNTLHSLQEQNYNIAMLTGENIMVSK